MNIRKEVKEFAEAMEIILRKHDNKKGDSWKRLDMEYLFSILGEEYEEAKYSGKDNHLEFVDLANVCMMLYHRSKKAKE